MADNEDRPVEREGRRLRVSQGGVGQARRLLWSSGLPLRRAPVAFAARLAIPSRDRPPAQPEMRAAVHPHRPPARCWSSSSRRATRAAGSCAPSASTSSPRPASSPTSSRTASRTPPRPARCAACTSSPAARRDQAGALRAGAIWDVIVDLRPESPIFRHWQGFELGAASGGCSTSPRASPTASRRCRTDRGRLPDPHRYTPGRRRRGALGRPGLRHRLAAAGRGHLGAGRGLALARAPPAA